MKYVGATDSFIRGPFLFEGAVIGAAGALVAFLIVSYGYVTVVRTISDKIYSLGISSFKIIPLYEIGAYLFLILFTIGIMVGMAGSIVAIRKHLKV